VRPIVLDLVKDPELLNETAKGWAEAIGGGTKKHQVRNFYDRLLKLKYDLDKGEEFGKVYPFIKMLNSKVAYARTRRVVYEAILGFFRGRN